MRWTKFKVTRNTVLFLAGLTGIYHEAFLTTLDRPSLLLLFAGMVGLPGFLELDERRKEKLRQQIQQEISHPESGV